MKIKKGDTVKILAGKDSGKSGKVLGIDPKKKVWFKQYKSPFPRENRLNLFVDKTTTKYTSRNEEQYNKIGETIWEFYCPFFCMEQALSIVRLDLVCSFYFFEIL